MKTTCLMLFFLALSAVAEDKPDNQGKYTVYVLKDGRQIPVKSAMKINGVIHANTLDGAMEISESEVVRVIARTPSAEDVARQKADSNKSDETAKSRKLRLFLLEEDRGVYDDRRHSTEQASKALAVRVAKYTLLAANPDDVAAVKASAQKAELRFTQKKEAELKEAADAPAKALALKWKNMPVEVKPSSAVISFDFTPGDECVNCKISVGEGRVNWRSFNVYFYEGNTRIGDRIIILKEMKRNTALEETYRVDPNRVTRIEVKGDLNF